MDPIILVIAGVALVLIVLIGLALLFFLRRQQRSTTRDVEEVLSAKPPVETTSQKVETNNNKSQPHTNSSQPTPASNHVSPNIKSALTSQPLDSSSDDKIRVLLVDDNLGTRDNVSRLLYFENDIEVIGQAVNGRQGVEMAVELKPHIVLMDINMPDMDGITATREMSVQAPYSQVIIMSVQSDQHYMKRAMAAGARDFQPKPFTSEELVNCIRRVYKIGIPAYQQFEIMEVAKTQKKHQPVAADGSAPKNVNTPVIAVYSPKGGVGTSAVAANLAIALHQSRSGVVLLDGDLQFGDISVHLNTRPERTISDLIHDGNLEIDLVQDILMAHNSGVKILLAPPQPQLADMIKPEMMKDIITSLKNDFKMVVIDTHNHLEELTLSILEMADYILLVLTPELPAIKSCKLFLELAEQLEFPVDHIKIVINRANMPGGINLTKLEKVLQVDKSYRIPYDSKLHFALNNRGLSIYQQDPSAPSARALAELTQELLTEMRIADDALETVP
ncbi:MAG: response regulator [Anaerolineae bacterium]|nr:response regulator [Anaerolineae bacterium]